MAIIGPGGGGGGGSPTGAAGGSLAGEYPNPTIAALAILTAALANEAVTEGKIAKAVQERLLKDPVWQEVEALNANLSSQGAPFAAQFQVALVNGQVLFRGAIKCNVEVAAKSVIFTLPASCRPETQRQITAGGQAGYLTNLVVKTNGEVEVLTAIKTANTPITLDASGFAPKG